jgi:hypothetical protein
MCIYVYITPHSTGRASGWLPKKPKSLAPGSDLVGLTSYSHVVQREPGLRGEGPRFVEGSARLMSFICSCRNKK